MFSQLRREDFMNQNYYPGPDYYNSDANSIQAKQIQLLQKAGDGLGTQSRVDRFKNSQKNNLGPGYYKYNDYWDQKQKSGEKKQKWKKSDNSTKIVFHSIPSIPKSSEGYQELENGILIAQDTKEDKNLGPGEYLPNYEVQQKRSISYSIKPPQQNFSKQQQNIKKDELNQNNFGEGQLKKEESFLIVDQEQIKRINKEKNQKEQKQKKKQNFKEIFEQQLKSSDNIKNMNLSQLVQKQKLMSRFQEGPDYVDREIYSCFKKQDKVNDIEGLGFNSKDQRFGNQHQKQISQTAGPGAYNITEKRPIQHAKFSQLPRTDSYIVQDVSIPGVGSYNPKAKIQPQFKPSKSKFNSAFGCGTQRFVKGSEEKFGVSCPAPGEYEVFEQFKQKKCKKNRSVTQGSGDVVSQQVNKFCKGVNRALLNKNQQLVSNLGGENDQFLNKFGLQEQNQNQDRISKQQQENIYKELQDKRKQRANSQFVSGTQRFKDFSENKGYNVGPGQYQNQNFSRVGQKNVYGKIGFGKADRFQYPIPYEFEKRIGPGYYDYDVKQIKKNIGAQKQQFL